MFQTCVYVCVKHLKKNVTEVRAAGRPTKRTDFQRTTVPRADKHLHSSESVTDMENLGDQQKTTVRDLISSSTFAERSLIDDVFKVINIIKTVIYI